MRAGRARVLAAASGKDKVLRRPIQWRSEGFSDPARLEPELRRVMDICHGCRRCFNLCDSFPRLFDAVDAAPSGELDTVPSSAFKAVADACTLCDMCFSTKCPYTPPHEFDLDFPHLVLRYRAMEQAADNEKAAAQLGGSSAPPFVEHHKPSPPPTVQDGVSRDLPVNPSSFAHRVYANQDLMGPVATRLAPIVNRVTGKPGSIPRKAIQAVVGVDQNAPLPAFSSKTFVDSFKKKEAAAEKRKIVLYATCFVNHNRPSVGEAVTDLLRAAGAHVEVCYPECCGMPQLEQGLVGKVAQKAERITAALARYVDDGFEVCSLTPSCSLMIKQEWPLLLPESETVKKVAAKTVEASELLLQMAKSGELKGPIAPLEGVVTLHNACHSRAQNIGFKSRDLLALVPKLKLNVIERCSGHGGTWGMENYETALKVGAPVFSKSVADEEAAKKVSVPHFVTSDCPMAADHITDGANKKQPSSSSTQLQPIEIFAKAYFART